MCFKLCPSKICPNERTRGDSSFQKGEIIEIERDDNTVCPYFRNADKTMSSSCIWAYLAYYEEEKTWDNLTENDVLVRNGLELEVIGVCGRMVFTAICEHNDSDSCQWTKKELINNGWKIKGASEDDCSNAISLLNSH